jgi:hypothetical protein
MSNKYLYSEKNNLLENRFSKLVSRLVNAGALNDFQTNEQIISETIRVLNFLYRDLTAPTFNPSQIIYADLPNVSDFNLAFQTILDDLTVIFNQLERTETLSVSNFNFILTESNRLFSRLKSVSSKLNDFILYANDITKTGLYFTDTFNNTTRLDVDSALLNETQCNINQDEGIITLPVNKDKTLLLNIKETPVVDSQGSNGVIGNNEEIDSSGFPVLRRANINVVLDNNPDTWFEYEKVFASGSREEDSFLATEKALTLDMSVNLGIPQIINLVNINPNNFGTKNTIKIVDILTSIDGSYDTFISIKDDIPVAGFIEEDEENIFELAPSTSKYAGQGFYSFTPRKAKYIRFIFEQNESYPINTNTGVKNRYAIGIRDINIYSFIFESKGEVISKAFSSVNEIKKVILNSAQNPMVYSELARIDYSLSPDDGQNWYDIQTKGFMGKSGESSNIPEILNFNTIDENTIETSVPVYSLRLKSVLTRNDANFTAERAASFQQLTNLRTELHDIPIEPPFSFVLDKIPVEGSIEIIRPLFGPRGFNNTQYEFKSNGKQTFSLFGKIEESRQPAIVRPWKKTSSGSNPTIYQTERSELSDFLHITVAGEEWTQATQSLSSYSANYSTDSQYRLFNLDLETATLYFGNGANTMAPPEDCYIGVSFDAEKLSFDLEGDRYFASLSFDTALDKDDLEIKRFYPVEKTTEILARGSTEVHLQNKNIIDTSGIESVLSGSKKTFLNGRDELSESGDWSIDVVNGVIYLYTATSSLENTVVVYTFQKTEKLETDKWDWVDGKNIYIKKESFETFSEDALELPVTTGIKVLHLAHLDVIKGTMFFTSLSSEGESIDDDVNPFLEEVEFIDGNTELITSEHSKSFVKVKQSISPFKAVTDSSGTTRYGFFGGRTITNKSLGHAIHLSENVASGYYDEIVFSNQNIFKRRVESYLEANQAGDYWFDFPNNDIILRITGFNEAYFSDPGYVEFYTQVSSPVTYGRFSVDYKKGIVYTDRPMNSDWILTASYEYSDFRAYYNISKKLDLFSYTVDVSNRLVTLNPKEILNRYSFPESRAGLYYQVNYKYADKLRTDVSELKDYFTPVLKAYSLKMITSKDLF